ncbi:hypothetical protein [Halorubrum persicum]|uniref:hypothetical protein n=1 Tax=Halorubrum persicum TaxID=1383844 RepID=UPI0011819D34|nr:hypothetical protein [Halorubrum persicum]
MNTETFDFEETTEAKRFTVVLDADSDVTEGEARSAIERLVSDDNADEPEETSDSEPRNYGRGYNA